MKTGKGAGAPSRRTRRTGEKTPAKKKRVTAARMPRAPKTEAERLRDAAAALAYLKDAPKHLVFTACWRWENIDRERHRSASRAAWETRASRQHGSGHESRGALQ